jgi:hypothetical protein
MQNSPGTSFMNSIRYYQELHNYLETEMQLIHPEPEKPEKGPLKAVKIIFSIKNTSPIFPDGPFIVFMGVGISVAHLGGEIQVIKPHISKYEKSELNDIFFRTKICQYHRTKFPRIH